MNSGDKDYKKPASSYYS